MGSVTLFFRNLKKKVFVNLKKQVSQTEIHHKDLYIKIFASIRSYIMVKPRVNTSICFSPVVESSFFTPSHKPTPWDSSSQALTIRDFLASLRW